MPIKLYTFYAYNSRIYIQAKTNHTYFLMLKKRTLPSPHPVASSALHGFHVTSNTTSVCPPNRFITVPCRRSVQTKYKNTPKKLVKDVYKDWFAVAHRRYTHLDIRIRLQRICCWKRPKQKKKVTFNELATRCLVKNLWQG
jgi:hypothetical protein